MSAKCGFTPLKHWTLGTKQDEFRRLVPKEGFEPTHPYGYYVLNVARLPFRHFGIFRQHFTHPPHGNRQRGGR